MNAKRIEGPFRLEWDNDKERSEVQGADRRVIALCPGVPADAIHVVNCLNAHDGIRNLLNDGVPLGGKEAVRMLLAIDRLTRGNR